MTSTVVKTPLAPLQHMHLLSPAYQTAYKQLSWQPEKNVILGADDNKVASRRSHASLSANRRKKLKYPVAPDGKCIC